MHVFAHSCQEVDAFRPIATLAFGVRLFRFVWRGTVVLIPRLLLATRWCCLLDKDLLFQRIEALLALILVRFLPLKEAFDHFGSHLLLNFRALLTLTDNTVAQIRLISVFSAIDDLRSHHRGPSVRINGRAARLLALHN